jgi:FtsP/CotA-like multicopper oxidase with cupredoxin domain
MRHIRLSRTLRRVFPGMAGGAAIVMVTAAVVAGEAVVPEALDMQNGGAMDTELAIPPLLEPRIDADGVKEFILTAREGRTEFAPGRSTPSWGFNGSYLGPTLRANRGDTVRVLVENELGHTTTVHWHGMKLPGAMDGGPHQPIRPGRIWTPQWSIDQPAATLWYHPHTHQLTADHVYRGLAGLFIIDDDVTPSELPAEYGVNDIPLIVQDKSFGSGGRLRRRRPFGSILGHLGDVIVVNGTVSPYADVRHDRIRLRVLNASNGRVYRFHFEDHREFLMIASDSGLLEAPVPLRSHQLSPGERAEYVVTLSAGETLRLQSSDPHLDMGFPMEQMNGGDDRFDILELRADAELTPVPPVPGQLASIERLSERSAVRTRRFELDEFSRINRRTMNMDRIDAEVRLGDVEIWEVANLSDTFHNFHIHLVHFQILDIDGQAPPPEQRGWKDTVQVLPGSEVRVIARFDRRAEEGTPFMFHCHILAHEDAGMMGQFTVTE